MFILRSASGTQFKIAQEITRVGRAPDNDVVIKDETVSRYHLTFYIKDGLLIVEDGGSQNGFLVNKQKVNGAVSLKPGDSLAFGNREFYVLLPGQQLPPPAGMAGQRPNTITGYASASAGPAKSSGGEDAAKRKKLLMVAAVFVLFAIAFRSEEKKELAQLPQEEDVPTKALLSEMAAKESATPIRSLTEIRSESKFNEAMRDYNNGLYNRALLGFQEAYTMNPGNNLAAEYVEFSQQKINNLVKEAYRDGEKSFTKFQFRRSRQQMFKILSIFGEQVPGFGRKAAEDTNREVASGKRISEHEKNLLGVPCDKVSDKKLCEDAKELLKRTRIRLKEEDVIQ